MRVLRMVPTSGIVLVGSSARRAMLGYTSGYPSQGPGLWAHLAKGRRGGMKGNQTWAEHYPLVNVYITMERSTIFHGKIHYFYGHVQ